MSEHLYLIQTEDLAGNLIPHVELHAESPNGAWAGRTNACGQFAPTLAEGAYSVDFVVNGRVVGHRDWQLADPPKEVIRVGLDVAASFPPAPSRDQVCALRTSLQGLTYTTAQYGAFPAWFYAMLSPADRAGARATHRAAGDTHITIPISEAYKEPGTLWPDELKQGYDFTQDLQTFRAILTEAICDGFFIDVPLAGDGMGAGPGYNDPVGNTYGYQWLMNELPSIVEALKGDGTEPDLTPFLLFRPGWDGVFYGWGVNGEVPDQQPDRVRKFGEEFRRLLPNGHLAIEHTPGNIPCGEGGGDFAPGGLMRNYDTILSEFNTVHEDSCWQVVARMVHPYHRPADQPSGDDPNPPFYLAPGNERGRYFYVAFEPTVGGVYEWCRGRCSLADVNDVRAYLRGLGCELTG
jgi:hypothetical protein